MARKRESEEKVLDMNANMQGTIVFAEPVNLRINGSFSGELKTRGTLFIGESADVNAEIQGEDITIAGKVKGNIHADGKLAMLGTAVVEGDIFTPALEVREGAIFQGISHMIREQMSVKEIARYLDIDQNKIVQWANEGAIPAVKKGESWLFEKARIDSWLKDNAGV
jgi:excisionase family DNA binding protein